MRAVRCSCLRLVLLLWVVLLIFVVTLANYTYGHPSGASLGADDSAVAETHSIALPPSVGSVTDGLRRLRQHGRTAASAAPSPRTPAQEEQQPPAAPPEVEGRALQNNAPRPLPRSGDTEQASKVAPVLPGADPELSMAFSASYRAAGRAADAASTWGAEPEGEERGAQGPVLQCP
eukprot:CAMPEP_0180505092 /NCGR_PEP_ID=MMETSP1036_2-20121128/47164_1 /TAXON_ID=632150 /ORGANISM="Azadinium spinosum, Strain 3D9" /LENGTH=175 /DNA_ID=CAMNT_0022514729 /DNA_START=118 /DNA_END=646 /DNA_ORIENTATION=+